MAYEVLNYLKQCFGVKFGEADVFVGMQISRNRKDRTIFLHRMACTRRLIQKFQVLDVPCNISADLNTILYAPKKKCILGVPYREAIGSLTFLSNITRPDLNYIVNVLSRYVCDFDKSHW